MPSAQITYNVTKEYAEELFGLTTHEYTLDELRRAFRDRAYECHPDMAKDEADLIEREAKCRIVNMAYARLKKQFIGKGDIVVKPMDEMIRESYEQNTNNSDGNDAIDDIIDFLDDFDDDIPTGNIPNWMTRAQNRIAYTNKVTATPVKNDIDEQFNHVDWNVNQDNQQDDFDDNNTVYSLPPFLRSQYLNRNNQHACANVDKRNDGRCNKRTVNGNNVMHSYNECTMNEHYQNSVHDYSDNNACHRNEVQTTPYKSIHSSDDIEAEIDKIMAKILHDAGC